MSFLGAIAKRNRRVEMMDDPLLANEQHIRALGGLARLNAVSLSTRNFWGPIAELGRRNGTRRLRVLDVATGAGDVPLGLLRKARGTRLELEAHGIDVSGRAVRFAQQRAAASRMRMDFSTRDALHGDLPSGFDVVMSSLFLHHLAEEQAVLLLEKMAKAARHLVLVSDLGTRGSKTSASPAPRSACPGASSCPSTPTT